jgi:hypothetical protein
MQYVNDDMDELFRRAAKDYPLNTESADWEKVKKALQDSSDGDDEKPTKRNNRRHFLWLLMLLPLPWICNEYGGEVGNGDTARNSVKNAPTASSGNKSLKETGHTAVSPSLKAPATSTSPGKEDNRQGFDLSNNSAAYAVPLNSIQTKRPLLSFQENSELSNTATSKPGAIKANPVDDLGKVVNKETNQQPPQESNEVANPIETAKESKVPDAKAEAETTDKKDDKADSTAATPSSTKTQKPAKHKRFYIGVLGGVDITSVEMQEVKNVGYDAGLIAGYHINSRWSVEAGLMSSEKAYYSKGEYLPKAYLLPNTKLKEASGDCRMWEVPLIVRYNFKEGKKGNWFASAGTSSYFMNKEDYYYTYYYPATGQEVERYRSYEQKSNHLFAAAQLSGGYNRNLGKAIGVRVEPYLKLPLKKVGYYDLPLTSFGVHVGITKKLF